MSNYLTEDPAGMSFEKGLTKMLVYVLTIYFQLFEIEQIKELGWSYWAELQNYIDTSSTILNLGLLLKYDLLYDHWYGLQTQQTLAAAAIGFMYYKLFMWMRIYGPTAFYMRLISETFSDVVSFFFMFIVLIFAFANILFILNSQREHDAEQSLYDEPLENGFFNSFINVYTLSHGEFATEGFGGTNSNLVWWVWFIGTFLLSITFLNMLIAIMNNSFDKVMDSKEVAGRKERIGIMLDYRRVVSFL